MKQFSVCMSVYRNDNPNDFRMAVESIYQNQILKPTEIIIVVDGPISVALDDVILKLKQSISIIQVVRLIQNMGHAVARQTGLDNATYDYIAIMDSDDIAEPDRFEKQMKYLNEHPDVSVVGGQINEFIGKIDNIVGSRVVPLSNEDISSYIKSRCPMNLMTVILKRQNIINVGGFIDWYCEEDYYLWIRLFLANAMFANLPDTLVNVRVGKEMYSRRGGWRYFKSEAKLQYYMFSHKIIGLFRLCYNVLGRFVIQVLMPNTLRGFIFQKLFRK